MSEFDKVMRREYERKKAQADHYNIEWRLSFEEFVELWRPHWMDRARQNLMLCRLNDSGAYDVGNVKFDTRANHMRDWQARRRREAIAAYVADGQPIPTNLQ
jgi:hypothetical protein